MSTTVWWAWLAGPYIYEHKVLITRSGYTRCSVENSKRQLRLWLGLERVDEKSIAKKILLGEQCFAERWMLVGMWVAWKLGNGNPAKRERLWAHPPALCCKRLAFSKCGESFCLSVRCWCDWKKVTHGSWIDAKACICEHKWLWVRVLQRMYLPKRNTGYRMSY